MVEQRIVLLDEADNPGQSIAIVARKHGLSPSLLFRWRQLREQGAMTATAVVATGRWEVKAVARTLRVARSGLCARIAQARSATEPSSAGVGSAAPSTMVRPAGLIERIEKVLADRPSNGYRTLKRRFRDQGRSDCATAAFVKAKANSRLTIGRSMSVEPEVLEGKRMLSACEGERPLGQGVPAAKPGSNLCKCHR
jgi:transposase-like protein